MKRLNAYTSLYDMAQASYGDNVINVLDEKYGVVADGASHPLSDYYNTLEDARAAYPNMGSGITSLDNQIDSVGIMEAYIDAVNLMKNNSMGDIVVDNNYASYMNIKSSLVIPRRYYRVSLGQVWFYDSPDILAEGAVFVGHDTQNAGKNYHRYPSSGQENCAKAVISLGSSVPFPDYIVGQTDHSPRNTKYYLPMIVADYGRSNKTTDRLEDIAAGTALWTGGMHNTTVEINGIYGTFRYGVVCGPISTGASFNTFKITEIAGPLINFKFCPIQTYPYDDSGYGFFTSNRIEGGKNLGPDVASGSEYGNSGICFDFDNQDDKPLNYPMPSGYEQFWKCDHFTISDFILENNVMATAFRLHGVNGLTVKRSRGEGWDRGMYEGLRGTTAQRVSRGPHVLVDMGRAHSGIVGVKDYSHTAVRQVVFEDGFGKWPSVEYVNEYSQNYQQNVVYFKGYNDHGNNNQDAVIWQDQEIYNYRPGSGPIVTATDGQKAFRIQMVEDNGSYTLQPKEVGLPVFAVRVSGTSDWVTLKDRLNRSILEATVGDYLEVKNLSSYTADYAYDTSSPILVQLNTRGVEDASEVITTGEYNWLDGDEISNLFIPITNSGTCTLRVATYYYALVSSGIDPNDSTVSGYQEPPFTNQRYYHDLINVR